MPSPLTAVLGPSLIPIVATAVGALYAAWRTPSQTLRSAIQHFAAGVVFSVVAVELLPDVTRVHDPTEIGGSFALGVALMLLIERFTRRPAPVPARADASNAENAGAATQLVAIGVDLFIDGLLVGIAFAAGQKEGILLVLALTLELLSLGLALSSTLAAAGAWSGRSVGVPTALTLLLPIGAAVGSTALRGASEHTLAGVLAFGAAALLYLVTEELLVEAHEGPDTTFATGMFFCGFLVFLLLGMLA